MIPQISFHTLVNAGDGLAKSVAGAAQVLRERLLGHPFDEIELKHLGLGRIDDRLPKAPNNGEGLRLDGALLEPGFLLNVL